MASGQSRRTWANGTLAQLIAVLTGYQMAAAESSLEAVPALLAEQGITAAETATVSAAALSGVSSSGQSLASLLEGVQSLASLDLLVRTQVADAGRVAMGLAVVTRPTLQGYVRYLNPPSCGRCAVLAGKFYRYSTGFLRHPQCDCVMLPSNEAPAADLVVDPEDLIARGLVRGLSKADLQAVEDGASISQVVNVRSKKAGLTVAGRVLSRGGRPTPEGIYALATDRADALRLLRKHKYIR